MPAHVVQRGNNRQAVFYEEQDYAAYLNWLWEGATRYSCAIHAYVLMTNHVHVLLTPEREECVSRLMQYLGRHYVLYISTTNTVAAAPYGKVATRPVWCRKKTIFWPATGILN